MQNDIKENKRCETCFKKKVDTSKRHVKLFLGENSITKLIVILILVKPVNIILNT
jgi:uncharacterized protein YggU (UPF0235/DUF167 family)